MPSVVIDELWHELIINTRWYSRFCDQEFGFFLHHDPENPDNVVQDKDDQIRSKNELVETWMLACHDEGLNPFDIKSRPALFNADIIFGEKDECQIKEIFKYMKSKIVEMQVSKSSWLNTIFKKKQSYDDIHVSLMKFMKVCFVKDQGVYKFDKTYNRYSLILGAAVTGTAFNFIMNEQDLISFVSGFISEGQDVGVVEGAIVDNEGSHDAGSSGLDILNFGVYDDSPAVSLKSTPDFGDHSSQHSISNHSGNSHSCGSSHDGGSSHHSCGSSSHHSCSSSSCGSSCGSGCGSS